MNLKRIAVHTLIDEDSLTFDPFEYSQFKYGSGILAQQFGIELAQTFCNTDYFKTILYQSKTKKIIVLPPPYINVPTAGYYLSRSFFNVLNQNLYNNNAPNAWLAKIYRQKSYYVDYGNMSAWERRDILSDEVFQVDSHFLKNNICLFIDDIRITGAHEERILKMLHHYSLDNFEDYYFLFYGLVAEKSSVKPHIESRLNRWDIHHLDDIQRLISKNDFAINTRVLKFILSEPFDDFKTFVDNLTLPIINELYFAALNNGYASLDELKNNFNYLSNFFISHEATSHILPDRCF